MPLPRVCSISCVLVLRPYIVVSVTFEMNYLTVISPTNISVFLSRQSSAVNSEQRKRDGRWHGDTEWTQEPAGTRSHADVHNGHRGCRHRR